MIINCRVRYRTRILPLFIALGFTGLGGTASAANPQSCIGQLSPEEIQACLMPPPRMKALVVPQKGVTVEGDQQKPGPSEVSLLVNFEFDSAELTNDGRISIDALGKALLQPALRDHRYQIAGHTDSVGTDAYNQRLSEQRAMTVRDYLTKHFQLDSEKLAVVGFGKTKLYDPANPEAGINRRVQITRVGD